jgi:nucleotide-binding universal stress UspA family protein
MSFDRVLVALDSSPGSHGVQERARELAGPTGALTVVHGTARAILEAADRVDADAIVIARGRAAFEVAARARVPTIVVAPGSRAPERALLALDFSTPSMLAAEAGTAIAERLGVPTIAIHVIDPRACGAGSRSVEDTRQGIGSLVQLAANRKVPVTIQLGVPAEEIVAATGPTDLLVCGSRRAGILERLLDPSVSTALLGEATGTSVVVPPPLGARPGREISRKPTARALSQSSS